MSPPTTILFPANRWVVQPILFGFQSPGQADADDVVLLYFSDDISARSKKPQNPRIEIAEGLGSILNADQLINMNASHHKNDAEDHQ